jgi:hypothetical protein
MKTLLPIALAATLAATLVACGGPTPTPAVNNADAAANDVVVEELPTNVDEAPAANAVSPAPAPAAAPAAKVEGDYLGRWVGVEGMYLDVAKGSGDGVTLDMQWDLDHKGTFDGKVTPAGIAFTREGKELLLKPTDGDATGLKYLAGKKDCLTVASGEGYCRR